MTGPNVTSAFGASDDLKIFDESNKNGDRSSLGDCYEQPQGMNLDSDQAKRYLAGAYTFNVKEFEVYSVTIIE